MKLVPAGPAHVGASATDELRGPTDRPEAQVDLPRYCIDQFEFPNRPGQHPRLLVTADEAEAACRQEGKRLCTEDEWEKACRGPKDWRFPYGPGPDPDACNTQDRSGAPRALTVAGTFAACKSGFGAFDLSGNAGELTATPFQAGSADRVVKGGTALKPAADGRCASRGKLGARAKGINVGFRCCGAAR
jgi:formylglycine-generating enzyme required for sulfatase activity